VDLQQPDLAELSKKSLLNSAGFFWGQGQRQGSKKTAYFPSRFSL
jgi:hypothetical protein